MQHPGVTCSTWLRPQARSQSASSVAGTECNTGTRSGRVREMAGGAQDLSDHSIRTEFVGVVGAGVD
jgi:hypothetical protein